MLALLLPLATIAQAAGPAATQPRVAQTSAVQQGVRRTSGIQVPASRPVLAPIPGMPAFSFPPRTRPTLAEFRAKGQEYGIQWTGMDAPIRLDAGTMGRPPFAYLLLRQPTFVAGIHPYDQADPQYPFVTFEGRPAPPPAPPPAVILRIMGREWKKKFFFDFMVEGTSKYKVKIGTEIFQFDKPGGGIKHIVLGTDFTGEDAIGFVELTGGDNLTPNWKFLGVEITPLN